jgi:lipoyl(octanoyl) transferase
MAAVPLRRLGRVDYAETATRMQAFTAARDAATPDEIWLCEHSPVYTLGVAGRLEHVHDAGGIPVVRSNRERLGVHVKEYVFRLEQALIRTLEVCGVTGHRVAGAPGVYVRLADPFGHAALDARTPAERHAAREAAPSLQGLGKIAALGIKVSRHRAYHGVALNVAMDLRPYAGIDPCGYAGLATVDLSTIGVQVPSGEVAEILGAKLGAALGA